MFGLRAGSILTLLAVLGAAALLMLTAAGPGESAGSTERYVVVNGDTLWSIAEARYRGDLRKAVWQIRETNELGKRSIAPGEVLELPAR